jgi:acyl-CoA synthetase (AMP-forming)/AMP-acid ligase II
MVAPGKERVAQDEHGEFARLPDGRPVVRIADILRANAAATPDAPAIIEADAVTSFAALDRLANRVANALARDGVRPGDRVAFLGSNSPAFLAVLYGAAKMGAIPTALNNRLAPAEISHILADAQPSVVVVGAGDDHPLPAAAPRSVCSGSSPVVTPPSRPVQPPGRTGFSTSPPRTRASGRTSTTPPSSSTPPVPPGRPRESS